MTVISLLITTLLVLGVHACEEGYFGTNCDRYCNPDTTCSGNGVCNDNGMCDCRCTSWECYSGSACNVCGAKFYGDDCTQFCDDEITCNRAGNCGRQGLCICDEYICGDNCDSCCLPFHNHPQCDVYCAPDSCFRGECSPITGECICEPQFTGESCSECAASHFGIYCQPCFAHWNGSHCISLNEIPRTAAPKFTFSPSHSEIRTPSSGNNETLLLGMLLFTVIGVLICMALVALWYHKMRDIPQTDDLSGVVMEEMSVSGCTKTGDDNSNKTNFDNNEIEC